MSVQEQNPASTLLEQVELVVYKTRLVTPNRDTGEGGRSGSRIEKVLQSCFDPQILRPLGKKKMEAFRLCRNFGTKLEGLGAWAVAQRDTPDLLERLGRIREEWDVLALELAESMSTKVEQWAAQHPADANEIRA